MQSVSFDHQAEAVTDTGRVSLAQGNTLILAASKANQPVSGSPSRNGVSD
jgi:hypothetical protein